MMSKLVWEQSGQHQQRMLQWGRKPASPGSIRALNTAPGHAGIRLEEDASSSTPLFTQAPGSQWLWFNTALVEDPSLRSAYAFAGWLAGQMVVNRASLSVPLPDLIFDKLLAGTAFQVHPIASGAAIPSRDYRVVYVQLPSKHLHTIPATMWQARTAC